VPPDEDGEELGIGYRVTDDRAVVIGKRPAGVVRCRG
jgi:hypothetical protein